MRHPSFGALRTLKLRTPSSSACTRKSAAWAQSSTVPLTQEALLYKFLFDGEAYAWSRNSSTEANPNEFQMNTHSKRKIIIYLFFFTIYLGGAITSWVAFSSIHGLSILFVPAWFPACQWISSWLAAFLGWDDETKPPTDTKL